MKKTITTEKYAKRFFTKNQLRYITDNGWAIMTGAMVPNGCTYSGSYGTRCIEVSKVTVSSASQLEQIDKAMTRRAKTLITKMPDVDAYYKEIAIKEAAARKVSKIKEKINATLRETGIHDYQQAILALRTGENWGEFSAEYSDRNEIVCEETRDYEGYGRGFSYPMTRRSFVLHIRKGWHLHKIGGLLTFVKSSKIDRRGMACEWIQQGRKISDIRTVKGFLVRGEHIKAKNLNEAKTINAERRAALMSGLLASRKKQQRENEEISSMRITFQDSLNTGNCWLGTSEFKHRYELAIGHEAEDISAADLRKYAKRFGVSLYAERVISYTLNRRQIL